MEAIQLGCVTKNETVVKELFPWKLVVCFVRVILLNYGNDFQGKIVVAVFVFFGQFWKPERVCFEGHLQHIFQGESFF